MIIVMLPSGVFPLAGEVGQWLCVGFLVVGAGACPLVGGTRSCPSDGQGQAKGYV